MKLIFVILVISILSGIDGSRRGSAGYRGRQLPFAGQPDATENSWSNVDLQKVERKRIDSEASSAENLDDTVVVGAAEIPFPESPNAARQYPGSWNQEPIDEVPNPIKTTTLPPQYLPTQRPQPPYQPQPSQQPPYQPRPPTQPKPQPTLPPGCLTARGQFPSQNSCANYLNCWDDVVIEQQCPNELLFNDVTGLCDFEYNVNCGSRPGPTPKPSLPNGSKRCPDPNGRYRSSTNCSVFYVCVSGSPIKFSCPRGLVYNDDYGVCDYVYNVDCQGAATPKPEPLPRPELPQQTQQPQQPTQSPQTERPDPTFPPGAYPVNPWLARGSEPDPWHQRPVSSQLEVDMKDEIFHNQANESIEPDVTENPTILNPWDLMHTVPAELTKVPCENGAVHRLNDACSSVVVCRDKRPQLVQCPQAQTYDKPSDSCQHYTVAKC